MKFYYVETRSVSDVTDHIISVKRITKTRAENKQAAVQKIKRQDRGRGLDNRDFTYTINPHSPITLVGGKIIMENETDFITRVFANMTLDQAEELVRIKRDGLNLAMNANLKAQLDHELLTREREREIVGDALSRTRREES